MNLKQKILKAFLVLALSIPGYSDNLKNTTIEMGDASAEAFVALGGFYKALDIIEKNKSYGDKYTDILREIRTSTYIDPENKHPYLTLADNTLADIHKKINESTKIIPREEIVVMIKKALDDKYSLFNAAKKEGKVKNN